MTQQQDIIPARPTNAPATPLAKRIGGPLTVSIFKDGDKDVTALVKMSADGTVRSMKIDIPIRPDKKECWGLGGYQKNPAGGSDIWTVSRVMTAIAYDKCNQAGSVSFFKPPIISIDEGNERPNPHIERNGRGDVRRVQVRYIARCRNAVGNRVFHDLTISYDLETYFAQDALSKWSKKSDTQKVWGELYDSDNIPDEVLKDPRKRVIGCPGGVSLVVDLKNKEVIGLFQEHASRQKFAERNAQTICKRNILKAHFAASVLDKSMKVSVVMWPEVDCDFEQMAEMAQAAASRPFVEDAVTGEKAEVVHEVAEASYEDIESSLGEETDEDAATGEDAPAPGVDVPQGGGSGKESTELANLRAAIRDRVQRLGASSDAVAEVFSGNMVSNLGQVAGLTDEAQLKSILKELEEAVLRSAQQTNQAPPSSGKLIDDGGPPDMEPPSRKRR